ncbi:NAD(P)-binding domain-containing protein [Streptomyces sp. NPDC006393]|uniref:NADPH-dependent F420 reductase n=1 Tax=Streptomyces sp. NPDC006393 TaxID=3156763 RepID=UPI0033F96792
MRISVIGAGSIGGTLALRWARLGHEVRLANSRGPGTLAGLVAGTSVAASRIEEVATGAEAVVLSIPFGAVAALPGEVVASFPAGAVVVDTGNYVPHRRDTVIDAIEAGQVESMWVAEQLGRPVVKAFNTIGAASLRDKALPAGAPGRVAAPVCADAERDRRVCSSLVDDAGFAPLDAGPLAGSWRQQPGTPVYTADLPPAEAVAALAAAQPDHTTAWRSAWAS